MQNRRNGESIVNNVEERRPSDELSYTLKRFVNAPVGDVWRYWTNPEHLLQWFGPAGFQILDVTTDLTVNGKWTTRMQSSDGSIHLTHGVYLEIKEESRLTMSQQWDGSNHSSEITVSLIAKGSGTEVVFEHRFLESVPSRESHAEGWNEALDSFERYIAT